MNKFSKFLIPMLVLATLLVSACGASSAAGAADPVGGGKPQPAPVEFTGVIEAIIGNQWTINGQTITVDQAVVHDGPFNVGDTVKVEASVQADGSVVVTSVETPQALVAPSDDSLVDASETPESPEVTSTPDPSASATPDPTTGGLVFDNNGNEAFGAVDSIDGNTIVIGGQTFQIANGAEFKDQIAAGNFVKVHFTLNADGTMSVTEIELSDPNMTGDDSIDSSDDDDSINDSNDNSDDDDNGSGSGQDDNGGDDDDSGSGGGDSDNSGSGDD